MDIFGFIINSDLYLIITSFALLGIGMILFIKDRFRYDAVALFLMVMIIVLGILPYEEAFANFGHPVIIIVGSMFIMSQALVKSGIIDIIVSRISFLHNRPILSLTCLVILVALISGFVNNIGALAMVMPIALHLAQKNKISISFYLLPIAFASHLGGYLTLIGTPRNIIISDFRQQTTGLPYEMFDFLPVGGLIALGGIVFLILYSWSFFSKRKNTTTSDVELRNYFTEASIGPKSKVVGLTIEKFHSRTKGLVIIKNIFRDNETLPFKEDIVLYAGDVLSLSGTEEALTMFVEKFNLQLTGLRAFERFVTSADDYTSIEVAVPPYAKIIGKNWNEIKLQDRFGTNFIGLYRHNFSPKKLLAETKIFNSDILLLQGRTDSVMSTINTFSLLPIANGGIKLGRTRTVLATLAIVISAITLATLQLVPLAMIFIVSVILLIGFNLVSLRGAYESIDWPVLVLLAGMITLGDALIASGTAEIISKSIVDMSHIFTPVTILIVILITTMLISDYINTTAAAVIMAPIAILVASDIGVSVDPFLIAVAIGASSAFQSPVGHESNAFVMQKGGYQFSDFVKIGLPLEILIVIISVPVILIVWPL